MRQCIEALPVGNRFNKSFTSLSNLFFFLKIIFRTTLIALFAFLKKVADNEAFSKMSGKKNRSIKFLLFISGFKIKASNLAVCFAPTLLRPEVENLESMTSPHPKAVVTLLIEEYDFIFKVIVSYRKILTFFFKKQTVTKKLKESAFG